MERVKEIGFQEGSLCGVQEGFEIGFQEGVQLGAEVCKDKMIPAILLAAGIGVAVGGTVVYIAATKKARDKDLNQTAVENTDGENDMFREDSQ